MRIHELRHSFASEGVMNGERLPTIGRLLGRRRLSTTAIYTHLDDDTLQGAAARAAGDVIQAMGFGAEALATATSISQELEEFGHTLNFQSGKVFIL